MIDIIYKIQKISDLNKRVIGLNEIIVNIKIFFDDFFFKKNSFLS